MRKPIYLDCKESAHLDLDGPSLLLSTESRAGIRFPLQQISRIVITGNCHLHSDAIRACAERGVVILVAGSEASSAVVVPSGGGQERLSERIERFLEQPDAPELYANWKSGGERREIQVFLRKTRIVATDLRPHFVARLREAHLLRMGETAAQMPRLAKSLLSARAAEWLLRKRVNIQTVEGRRRDVCLVSDCGTILTWGACADFLNGAPRVASLRDLANLLEARASRDAGRTHALLSSFCEWLGGLR